MAVESNTRQNGEGFFKTGDGLIAVALCGGLGKRMREVTHDLIPKALITLNGKKLIDYSIDTLLAAGVRNFLFASSHLADHIEIYANDKFTDGQKFHVAKDPIDTHGVVIQTRYALDESDATGPTVLFDCDAVRYGLDFRKAYAFHRTNGSDITFVGTRVSKPQESNFVVFQNDEQEALALLLHPHADSVDQPVIKCGMMICSERATQIIRDDHTITDSWIGMIEVLSTLNRAHIYISPDIIYYANINTPEDLELASGQISRISSGA